MIGVYGGTFNPIHLGHLRAAEEVAEALGLRRVLFVPSARPPHKRATEADCIAPAALRFEWAELAVRGNPRFAVDPIEIDREGPSWLVDTLEELRRRHAGEELVFILGRDAFEELGSWREPARLVELAHFAITTRPPAASGALEQWMPASLRGEVTIAPGGREAHHRRAGTWMRVLEITLLDVSASQIRARLRRGASVRYLLPEAVREAILASGCYGRAAERE